MHSYFVFLHIFRRGMSSGINDRERAEEASYFNRQEQELLQKLVSKAKLSADKVEVSIRFYNLLSFLAKVFHFFYSLYRELIMRMTLLHWKKFLAAKPMKKQLPSLLTGSSIISKLSVQSIWFWFGDESLWLLIRYSRSKSQYSVSS